VTGRTNAARSRHRDVRKALRFFSYEAFTINLIIVGPRTTTQISTITSARSHHFAVICKLSAIGHGDNWYPKLLKVRDLMPEASWQLAVSRATATPPVCEQKSAHSAQKKYELARH
jgi:hypothetical protein